MNNLLLCTHRPPRGPPSKWRKTTCKATATRKTWPQQLDEIKGMPGEFKMFGSSTFTHPHRCEETKSNLFSWIKHIFVPFHKLIVSFQLFEIHGLDWNQLLLNKNGQVGYRRVASHQVTQRNFFAPSNLSFELVAADQPFCGNQSSQHQLIQVWWLDNVAEDPALKAWCSTRKRQTWQVTSRWWSIGGFWSFLQRLFAKNRTLTELLTSMSWVDLKEICVSHVMHSSKFSTRVCVDSAHGLIGGDFWLPKTVEVSRRLVFQLE